MEIRKRIKEGFRRRFPRLKIPKFKRSKKEKPTELNPGEIKIPWYHFYKRNGFKRVTGFVVGLSGLVLKLIPDTAIIGEIVMYVGGSLGIVGVGDALKKNREKDEDTFVDNNKVLRFFADLIIKLIKQYLKKKGK